MDSQQKNLIPDISVIMPIYNTAPYLRDALNSICNQTLRNLQIILVDDGSTDASPDINRTFFLPRKNAEKLSLGSHPGNYIRHDIYCYSINVHSWY